MKIKAFNSLTGKKEYLPSKKLKLFVCGPTVYDFSHLGHARTYIFFDFFVKILRQFGYKVFYLQNITDIDDKIINRAKQENKNPLKLANYFKKIYLQNMKALNINSVNVYAPATQFITQIVNQVKRLINLGYAYKIEGEGYYFDVSKFKDYGKLSRRTIFQAEDAVSRIDESIQKKNKADFCLWKFPSQEKQVELSKISHRKKFIILDHEPLWKTKLGWGRPGWHIEDTAISEYYFGLQYDLHGGGMDLKFPHHEAEIAQAESLSGKKPFVKIWLHTGQLLVDGQKMSKSLGNFITIQDFIKKYQPIVLRYLVLMHHWRAPLNYEDKVVGLAIAELQNIFETIQKIKLLQQTKKFGKTKINISTEINEFKKALENDLNTPQVLAALFKIIKKINSFFPDISQKSVNLINLSLKNCLNLLSIKLPEPQIPLKIKSLLRQREKFRANKQFIQADALRNKILALGYNIEDTPIGSIILPKKLWIK